MTWDSYHRRGEVLKAVIDEANSRRDGTLPTDLPGVAEAFGDDTALVAALQMRWRTRLEGSIERALLDEPSEPESAVMTAWCRNATELTGVREILDACAESPRSESMAEALRRARDADWALLAAMAGAASAGDPRAAAVGRGIEQRARALYRPGATRAVTSPRHRAPGEVPHASLLSRLRARLAA
jgi:hypothetical protein